eukprot:Platyproteum_vivax@DN15066_c0_g1_i1.p1
MRLTIRRAHPEPPRRVMPWGWNRIMTTLRELPFTTLQWSFLAMVNGLQFMEWWYRHESDLQPMMKSQPPLPPPEPMPATRANPDTIPLNFPSCILPQDCKQCPLCQRTRTNPACSSSGYVFCYPCIARFVQEHGRCPVTAMLCQDSEIRRVFENRL